jgi:hypothetical protein
VAGYRRKALLVSVSKRLEAGQPAPSPATTREAGYHYKAVLV